VRLEQQERRDRMIALQVEAVKPFDAKLFLDLSIHSVQPLAAGAVASTGGIKVGGTRARDMSKSAQWTLDRYIAESALSGDGSKLVLWRAAKGQPWGITSELGTVEYEPQFSSANEATDTLVARARGKSVEEVSYNANKFWSARVQEDAANGIVSAS
jgi:hypothetical protein